MWVVGGSIHVGRSYYYTLSTSWKMHQWLLWLIYCGLALALVRISVCPVQYLLVSEESHSTMLFFTSGGGLFLTFLLMLTPPIDIYSLHNQQYTTIMKDVYESLFVLVLVFTFFVLPFAYFYAKQPQQSDRLKKACKRTLCYLVALAIALTILVLIVVCGLKSKNTSTIDWLKPFLKMDSDFALLIRFCLGFVLFIGVFLWVSVTAKGLATVPIFTLMLQFNTSVEEASRDENFKVKQRNYHHSNQYQQQQNNQNKCPSCIRRCLGKVTEFVQRVIGLLLLVVSLLVVTSILLTLLDQFLHSAGPSHGFLMTHSHFKFSNPLDQVFVFTSQYFPLDYVSLLIIFLVLISISAVTILKNGFGVWPFRLPNAILKNMVANPSGNAYGYSSSRLQIFSLVSIYACITILFSILQIAPQYASFGHQVYYNISSHQSRPCTLQDARNQLNFTLENNMPLHGGHLNRNSSVSIKNEILQKKFNQCRLSQLALFYCRLAGQFPVFGTMYVLGHLFFCIAFFGWLCRNFLLYGMYKNEKKTNGQDSKREMLLNNYA